MNGIELHSVAYSYDRGAKILDGVTLSIEESESFGILGPLASGKSTLLKLIGGLLLPTSGRISVCGTDTEELRRIRYEKKRAPLVTMAFQRNGLFDSMTVEENLSLPLCEFYPMSSIQRKTSIQEALKEVGLEGTENHRVWELSGGMQKRLGLCRAFILKPRVILLDDPTAGLDPLTSRAIVGVIQGLQKKQSVTLVVVGSDPFLVFDMCDRAGILTDGHFIQVATPKELQTSEESFVKRFMWGEW